MAERCAGHENKGNYTPAGRWKLKEHLTHTCGSLFLCNESNSGILLLLLFVWRACHPGFRSCWPNFENRRHRSRNDILLRCVFLPVDTMRECVISPPLCAVTNQRLNKGSVAAAQKKRDAERGSSLVGRRVNRLVNGSTLQLTPLFLFEMLFVRRQNTQQ